MASRGGARPGAGRKPGQASQKTRDIANKAAAEGLTPLEVMMMAMRQQIEQGDMARAAQFAKDAAPYMHPRMNAIEHSGVNGGPIETASTVKIDVAQLAADELAALKTVLSKVVKD